MKSRLILLVLLIIVADQIVKLYIKTHFFVGEEIRVFGLSWFRIHFVENEGMAWGWKWGGDLGKLALTLFRLIAVIAGVFIIRDFIRKKYHPGFLFCSALIFAGALGNLIDSMFYGLIFTDSNPYTQNIAQLFPKGGGYGSFLHGKVVDMLHFPLIRTTNAYGVEEVKFFQPVFNIADASISVGVIIILLFQKKFFNKEDKKEEKELQVQPSLQVDDNVASV